MDEKGTRGEERKQNKWAFQTYNFTPSQLKKGGRNLLSKAGNTSWQTAHLAPVSPSWPSDPTPILSPWRTVKLSFSAPERMTSVQTESLLEGMELFLDLGP